MYFKWALAFCPRCRFSLPVALNGSHMTCSYWMKWSCSSHSSCGSKESQLSLQVIQSHRTYEEENLIRHCMPHLWYLYHSTLRYITLAQCNSLLCTTDMNSCLLVNVKYSVIQAVLRVATKTRKKSYKKCHTFTLKYWNK